MHQHRLLSTEGKVFLVNTFHRALNVGEGAWSEAPQVVSWAQGTPFLGLAGKREIDIAGNVRVYVVGPSVEDGRPYLRVVRVLEQCVFDAPYNFHECREFARLLDAYAASEYSEGAWLLANDALRRWSNAVLDMLVERPGMLRSSGTQQNWKSAGAASVVGHPYQTRVAASR